MLARPYLATVSAQLHLIGLCAAGFGAVTALVAPLAFPGVRDRARRVCAVRLRSSTGSGERRSPCRRSGAWPVAGRRCCRCSLLVGLAVRPYLQTVRGQTDPAMIRQVAALQRLERLPVDGLRQYFESSLYWVLLVPRGARRAARLRGRRRRSGGGRCARRCPSVPRSLPPCPAVVRLWALPFLIIGWSVVTVLWDPAVVPWQPAGVPPAGARGAARALAAGVVGVVAADVARLGARRLRRGRRPGRDLLRARPGDPAAGDDPEPGSGRQAVGRPVLVGRGEAREPGAAARRRRVGDLRRLGRRRLGAVRRHRPVGERPVHGRVDAAAKFAPVVRGLCGQPAALVVLGPSSGAVGVVRRRA